MESKAENATDLIDTSGDDAMGPSYSQVLGATSGLAGILGNGLVCFVMLRYRSAFSSVTSKLMLHQSVVDFVFSALMLSTRLYTPWTSFYCRFFRGWLYWTLANVSSFSLLLICCDRYVAVCHAAKYRRWFSFKRVMIGLVFVWLLPILWQFYTFLYYTPDGAACVAVWPEGSSSVQLGFGVATFCWEYVLPLALIVVTYGQTILALRKRLRVKANQAATEPSTSRHNPAGNRAKKDRLQTAKVKLTITFLVVAIFFVICWGPAEITWLLFNFEILPLSYYSTLWHWAFSLPLLCLNSVVNPIIYFVTYTHFRKHLIKALRGGCKFNRVENGSVENGTEQSPDTESNSTKKSVKVPTVSASISQN
ncbi:galanin receptor 2b-like [Patiria miniata]|uniref:G-protein coupled receptors family 1 profile domain-containing protein n=1 Tax=Patiria miniata TaxID=46514 RepID=A0A913ZSA1_PATMI|nr:galanin receptor 2b-like [Patiria miniata]